MANYTSRTHPLLTSMLMKLGGRKKKKERNKEINRFGVSKLDFVMCKCCNKCILTLSRPAGRGGGGGGGLLEPAPTLKIYNFQTVKAITTKFGDFP